MAELGRSRDIWEMYEQILGSTNKPEWMYSALK